MDPTEKVGEGNEELNDLEPAGDATPPEDSPEVVQLKADLAASRKDGEEKQSRIDKYDGERSTMSGKVNSLEATVTRFMAEKKEETGEEVDLDDPITKGELEEYKKGEPARFEKFNDKKTQENQAFSDSYTKSFVNASLSIENKDTFNAIVAEHDALQNSGNMPASTGDPKLDGERAWEKAELVYTKKMNAAGKQIPFKAAHTPGAKGVGGGGLDTPIIKKETVMPAIPDDAKQLAADLGMGAEEVKEALA